MVRAKKGFGLTLKENDLDVRRGGVNILQVNIGKLCNQACSHCHVEAGPKRTENMERETIDRILYLLEKSPDIHTVDITGGAPELNPSFRYFVQKIKRLEREVIDRCNLTVLFEKGQGDTAEFLASNKVQVVASLPCYVEKNVDQQRGKGVFGKSVRALVMLNALGYGVQGSGLELNLVYNPLGDFLPPDQNKLKQEYKIKLKEDLGVVFNDLYAITNMPIKRYVHYLKREGKLEAYMQLLLDNFNVQAAKNVMCGNMLSIGYDGQIYDCDFNQMLDMPVAWKKTTLWDIENFNELLGDIAFADHCYGCTAGAGSSCGGEIAA